MNFERNETLEKIGKKLGFILASSIFLSILYLIIDYFHTLKQIKYAHVLIVIIIIAIIRILKK